MSSSSVPLGLTNDQWMDIIQYLGAEELKALRLAGNKTMCISDPCFTSHLQLRMDRVPFFCENNINFSEPYIRRWLENRHRLVINNMDAKICPSRVGYLVANGYLNSVAEIVIHNCHRHRAVLDILSRLPNVKSLVLLDQEDRCDALSHLEAAILHVGNMRSLESLEIELNMVVHGSRLSFLRNLDLKHLRLVGFNLCDGISYIGNLRSLQTLHLCHGNFYSSPADDANEKDLMALGGLTKIQSVHLEGFDCLTGAGLVPFSADASIRHLAMKHCQELNESCLLYAGKMAALEALHFVNSSCDDVDAFDRESLQHVNMLSSLRTLSLFYVLCDVADLKALQGLTSLETLNLALEDSLNDDEIESLCRDLMHIFPSLRRLRIFSEDSYDMECSTEYSSLAVELTNFTFGDQLYLD